jgi:hypothetical protein
MLDPNEVFGGCQRHAGFNPEADSQEQFVPYTMIGCAEDPTREHTFE